jgi:hypothetical protein
VKLRRWPKTTANSLSVSLNRLSVRRSTALSIVAVLLVCQIAIGVSYEPFATIAPSLLTAIVGIIAYIGIPPNRLKEARRTTDEAIAQYVFLQDATPHQRNNIINRMRWIAPQAQYSGKEIRAFLSDHDEAKRYAGLVSVQWHWPHDERPSALGGYVHTITPASTEEQKSTDYFPELMDLLCKPERQFEHYHVIDTVWGMSGHLPTDLMEDLCSRVCDAVECQPRPEHQSEKWSCFVCHVKGICAKRERQQ